MSVRDFEPRGKRGNEIEGGARLMDWLDRLGDRQNMDLYNVITSLAASDKLWLFDASSDALVATAFSTLAAAVLSSQTRFHVGAFTRDLSTASGDQAVTGVTFQPSAVLFLAGVTAGSAAWSVGFDDGSTPESLYSNHYVTADTMIAVATASIFIQGSAGDNYAGIVKTFDADGLTVTWTKTGSPSATTTIYYLALK